MSDKQVLPKKWNEINYNQVGESVYFLKGNILTIIEALGLEKNREKAVKDLIHGQFGTCINKFWRHAIGNEMLPTEGVETLLSKKS